jgi:hypothetical protein
MSKNLALISSLVVGGIAIFAASTFFSPPAAPLVNLYQNAHVPSTARSLSSFLTFKSPVAGLYAPMAPDFEKAKQLLAAGNIEGAKEEAEQALTYVPYSAEGYQVMMDISRATDDIESELRWGKWLAWSLTASGSKDELEVLTERMDGLYEGWNQDEITLGSWRDTVSKSAKKAGSKKQYRLAGHLMNKLLDLNPSDKQLNRDYDKLADKAGTEISGGAFVSDKVRRKSAKWLAKNNAKHSDWENRWTKKTKNYDVETNMDYEFFETLAAAMDQMNAFYRSVYDYKKKTKRVRLAVHRKRTDFDRFSMEVIGQAIPSEGVGGYWVNGLKTVAAYDRSMGNPDKTRDDLWNTLFHEASHQFMSILMKKQEGRAYTPAWLNEGTASYFEGCKIKADGTIVKNNVAEGRLRSWFYTEQSDSRKSLEDLVAHIRNTGPDSRNTLSYEGVYYSYGWALAYFLLNYEENDRRVYAPPITPGQGIPADYKSVRKAGRLVYRQPYLDYIEHFAKVGNKDNDQYYPLEIAKKLFVDEVGDPDVPNWDAFEVRWRKFTNSLYGEMLAGPEFADVLQSRCRGYILAEDYERARVTAEQADDKRPFDAETYRLLALSNLGEGLTGDAIFWMFRHWESVWQAGLDEEVLIAEDWLRDNGGKDILATYIEPTKEALAQTHIDMETALEDGHPIMATLFATHAMQSFQVEFPDLLEKAAEMSELAGQDLRVWQAAYDKSTASNRTDTDDEGSIVEVVKYSSDGLLMYNPKGWASPGYERTDIGNLMFLEPPFSIRGEVQIDGDNVIIPLGIDRSGSASSRIIFTQESDGSQEVALQTMAYRVDNVKGEASLRSNTVYRELWRSDDPIRFIFHMDVDGKGSFTINDDDPVELPEEFNKNRLTGGFAVIPTDDTAALFSQFAVRPNKAFWPVSAAEDEE